MLIYLQHQAKLKLQAAKQSQLNSNITKQFMVFPQKTENHWYDTYYFENRNDKQWKNSAS